MYLFITARILDAITTLMNINKYGGWGVELNPWIQLIGAMGLFIPYQIIITTIICLLVNCLKYRDTIYIVLSIFSILAIIINFWCLTL